jgi:hypothetical protein
LNAASAKVLIIGCLLQLTPITKGFFGAFLEIAAWVETIQPTVDIERSRFLMKPLSERIITAIRASSGSGTCPTIFNAVNGDGDPAATKDGFEKTCQDLHDEDRVVYERIPHFLQPLGTLKLSEKDRQHWILEILGRRKKESELIDLESVRQECRYGALVFLNDCRCLWEEGLVELVGQIGTERRNGHETIVATGKITSPGEERLRKESLRRLGFLEA